jgi:hypothetical protein
MGEEYNPLKTLAFVTKVNPDELRADHVSLP